MRYAMIAKQIKGKLEAVGTIDIDEKGFKFETADKKLKKLLTEVQKKGIDAIVDGGERDNIHHDLWKKIKITENRTGPLQDLLEQNGYYWWEEKE
ncbi:MAG: hypothetical protein AB1349_01535 [Elusimicrobiota bacterium]